MAGGLILLFGENGLWSLKNKPFKILLLFIQSLKYLLLLKLIFFTNKNIKSEMIKAISNLSSYCFKSLDISSDMLCENVNISHILF